METRITEIAKSLPDYEDFVKLSTEIGNLLLRKLQLETRIKAGEAEAFRKAMTEEKYQVNGKPPAVSFVENAYKHSGLDGELIPLREEYADIASKLEEKKILLDTYKSMLDIWRTLSANERSSAI